MPVPQRPKNILSRAIFAWRESINDYEAIEKNSEGLFVGTKPTTAGDITGPAHILFTADAQVKQIVAEITPMARGVQITALPDNLGNIWWGLDNTVDNTNGVPLFPTESEFIAIDDLFDLHIYGELNGDGFAYVWK